MVFLKSVLLHRRKKDFQPLFTVSHSALRTILCALTHPHLYALDAYKHMG